MMIFNANLDKSGSNRKNTKELRNELKNWEDSRKRRHLVDDTAAHIVSLLSLLLMRMLIASLVESSRRICTASCRSAE